jgi:uncharacterized protein DUF3108
MRGPVKHRISDRRPTTDGHPPRLPAPPFAPFRSPHPSPDLKRLPRWPSLAVTGALLFGTGASAQAQLPFDVALLQGRNDSMVVSVGGRVVGWYTSRLAKVDNGFRLVDQLSLGELAQQRTEIQMEKTGRIRWVQLGGITTGIQIRASLEYRRNRVRGLTIASLGGLLGDSSAAQDSTQSRSIEVPADTILPPGTIDDNALLLYLPALPWAAGARWSFPVFSGQENVIRMVTFTVRGTAAVALRSGTVEAWEVEATGTASPMRYYISLSSPHRLVRLDFTSVGLVYMLEN